MRWRAKPAAEYRKIFPLVPLTLDGGLRIMWERIYVRTMFKENEWHRSAGEHQYFDTNMQFIGSIAFSQSYGY